MKKQAAEVGSSGARFGRLVLAEEFLAVLDEADENDHGLPHKAGKKHHFQNPHCKNRQYHTKIVACFSPVHGIFIGSSLTCVCRLGLE